MRLMSTTANTVLIRNDRYAVVNKHDVMILTPKNLYITVKFIYIDLKNNTNSDGSMGHSH